MDAVKLLHLPDDALELIATHLSIPTLVQFALTCKSLANVALSERQFRRRLLKAYDLDIKTLPGRNSFKEVYRHLYQQKSSGFLRFQGVGTDGGVDSSTSREMLYWIDNMFVADHLEIYCSEIGQGIAVYATLQPSGETRQDRERRERVEFLRRILRVPLQTLLPVNETGDYMHRPLESWSLTDLERFLTELWTNGPQPPGEPGPWLRESVAILAALDTDTSGRDIMAKVQEIVHSFQARFSADDEVEVRPAWDEGPCRLRHESYHVIADPANRNALIDADLMPTLLAGPRSRTYSVGLLAHIEINRKGTFSCPVRSGAILACVHTSQAPEPATPAHRPCSGPPTEQWFKGMAALESRAVSALRNCISFTQLQQHVADGELPAPLCVHVHRGHNHFQGVTVEFQAPAHGSPQELQPVLWFQFFSADEDQTLQIWEAAVLQAAAADSCSDQDPPGTLPPALGWVKQYFDPCAPAAACDACEAAAFQSWDSGTFHSADNRSCSDGPSDWAEGEEAGTSAMHAGHHCEEAAGTSAGSSLVYGAAYADGDGASESDTESDDWFLGADDAQRKSTCGRHKLNVALRRQHAANLMCVALADQENLMRQFEDDHPHPNIDIQFVKFTGREVRIPTGTVWASECEPPSDRT